MSEQAEVWDLWFPAAAARGLAFARGRLDATTVLLVHAPPEVLDVEVRRDDGTLVARGTGLRRTAETPMARLTRHGDRIARADIWPAETDIETKVILPGGEVGVLLTWWNDDQRQQWRWRVEFYNHR